MRSTRSVRNASQSRGATARSAATTSVREFGRTAGERSGPPKKPPQKSSGKRSLDDFCGGFFGGPERSPAVRPYSRTGVVAAARAVGPLDWGAFLAGRVAGVPAPAPLAG